MSATLTREPSQSAFEEALRDHLTGRPDEEASVPDVNGVRAGIDLAALDELRERLGLGQDVLEHTLGVSMRTLQRRRRDAERLTPVESDRLWRLLHIFSRALQAFEGREEVARRWLTTPKTLLEDETPLERLDTEPGLRQVEDMLTVIDETAAA